MSGKFGLGLLEGGFQVDRMDRLIPDVQMAPRSRNRPPIPSVQQVTVLSPREQQVAALPARNLSNRQIAGQLVITERTVAAHIEHILDKLGLPRVIKSALGQLSAACSTDISGPIGSRPIFCQLPGRLPMTGCSPCS